MSDIIREPRLEATKFFKYQIDKNARCIHEFFKSVSASQWSLSSFVKYIAKLETRLGFEQLFKVFVKSLDQICVLLVVPVCVRAFAQNYLKWLETCTGKAMVNECREYFFAKVTLQEKTELKDVFKDTVNVTAQAEAYRAYITAPAVPTKSSTSFSEDQLSEYHTQQTDGTYTGDESDRGTDEDVQERHNDKVDEELIEASTEKKRKDEDDVTSTPPTKRSRSRYESSYSPSPSEVEELPSLTTDSIFNEEPITQARSSYFPSPSEVEVSPTTDSVFNEEPITQIRIISTANETEVKSTCNDNDEESSSSPPNQELPSIIVNEDGDIMTDTEMMRDRYLRIRRDLCEHFSQKDWFIEDYNVSDGFRKYQIDNIDKLVVGETFDFSSNSEAILSLHNIMFIDSTTMRKPSYLDIDDRKWRISIRQPKQQIPPNFLGEIMDEYEAEINDIDELRSKFYDMWGKYRDRVIYSDNERRLFEAIQAVSRAFFERMHMYPDSRNKNEDTFVHDYVHDAFKEMFRDPNYEIIWANTESLSSREHRATYGRSKGRKPDITIYRVMKKDDKEETCKVEHEETCFVEAKHLSVTRNSKIGGYNRYKVAILCQGGINRIISSRGNIPKLKSFGGHICEGYIYLGMMDLEYDGIYRYFQLSEIKLAQKLSEFNLVRKLIVETFYFKCRIDSFYSSENNESLSDNISCHNGFSRNPTISPKARRNSMIPVVSLIEKTTKTNNRKSI
ncbi:unnamed protein product [Rhizophagus irregularis]|nr:unnamed protein product [Rhizophagus irregularis]